MKHGFELLEEGGLMLVKTVLNQKFDFRLALDTGCSHTTFDLNALVLAGIRLQNTLRQVAVETTNGVVFADILKLKASKAWGMRLKRRPFRSLILWRTESFPIMKACSAWIFCLKKTSASISPTAISRSVEADFSEHFC